MNSRMKAKIGIAGLGAVVLTVATTLPAFADYEPTPSDVVGVGGDTPQFDLAFGADGDTLGDPGYNTAGNINKLISFNATADSNARQTYANGSTETAPLQLNPTDVLRAGTYPVQRVSSSGAAISALLADTATPEVINYVFSASLPTSAQQTQATNQNWGFLHVVQLGTDSVQIAAASTTNAVPLSAAELVGIYDGHYKTWNSLPGNSGGSGDTIIPLLPPSTSSITKTFVADLKTANGNVAPTVTAATVEQNDPTAITSLTAAQQPDAIVPFSSARLALFNSGYFHNPATPFPGGGTALTSGIQLLSGATSETPAGSAYNSPVTHYVIFRQSDLASTTPFQPGGTKNWVQTLFSNQGGTKPFFDTTAGLADIAAAGTTPSYSDLGEKNS